VATIVSSAIMAFGPLGGGWIFDTFGRHTWLWAGSFALGLGAQWWLSRRSLSRQSFLTAEDAKDAGELQPPRAFGKAFAVAVPLIL
jgi:hypothetical protein